MLGLQMWLDGWPVTKMVALVQKGFQPAGFHFTTTNSPSYSNIPSLAGKKGLEIRKKSRSYHATTITSMFIPTPPNANTLGRVKDSFNKSCSAPCLTAAKLGYGLRNTTGTSAVLWSGGSRLK